MIKALLFDLDDTLYSPRYGLEDRVGLRIRQFVARYLHVSLDEAIAERAKKIAQYGTTLEWLQGEKGLTDIEAYLSFVHPDHEADALPPDPRLGAFLKGLPQKKAIVTNSPLGHVDRILARLGWEKDLFDEIYDLRRNHFRGTPDPEAVLRPLRDLEVSPKEAIFVDDSPKYISGFVALGGLALLKDETDKYPGFGGEKIHDLEEITRFLPED
jgi:putative hydrolase of the HAD superfamily